MSKKILNITIVTLILLLATPAMAVKLRTGHPNEVIVTKGDTLWDISGRFLKNPWEWPKLWKANSNIKNPHLIYPGDRLTLNWVNGQPRLTHARGGNMSSPIPTVSFKHLSQFLHRHYLLDSDSRRNAGYVVGFSNETLIGGAGSQLYARNLDNSTSKYDVVRPDDHYTDYETGEPLGQVALFLGTATVKTPGDPATLQINESDYEIMRGDILLPHNSDRTLLYDHPSVSRSKVSGHVIAVPDALIEAGQFQTIVIDRGASDGLKPGNVLMVNTASRVAADPWAIEHQEKHDSGRMNFSKTPNVTLPEEHAGKMIVYRVMDRISFGVISQAVNRVKVGDTATTP